MSAIIDIGRIYPFPSPVQGRTAAASPLQTASGTSDGDTVELSGLGRALARGVDESSFRIARVRAIKAEVNAGIYETPQRIDGTAARLLDVLG